MSMERTLSIMLFLCALAISVKAQSPTQNYVLSKDVLDVDGTHAITTVTYYDGLGYPVETATNSLGGMGKNNWTFGLIDDLTYSYNGNQIKAISDKAGSLLYEISCEPLMSLL